MNFKDTAYMALFLLVLIGGGILLDQVAKIGSIHLYITGLFT